MVPSRLVYLVSSPLSLWQQGLWVLIATLTAALSVYGINILVMSVISLRRRGTRPKALQPEVWPLVSIQLPLFNEECVARRLIQSCLSLDYPRDRFEIIIVDDSSDGTTKIASEFAWKFPELVKVIHRSDRRGFKAGALQTAFENSHGEFVALFDADYVPPKDFLRKMVPYLCADGSLAFAQARWSYLDGGFSWIAKAVSLAIDIYAFVDQRARSSANLLAHFSGTCGVFRRKAIADVGGWSADTLAEDLDLSIRLQLAGWRYVYVPNVVCPGEIPPDIQTLMQQQFRWAKGFSECLRKHWLAIVRSHRFSLFQKIEALIHLGTYFVSPLALGAIILGIFLYLAVPLSFFLEGFWKHSVALATLVFSIPIYLAPLFATVIAVIESSRERNCGLRRLFHLWYLGLVVYSLILTNTRAAFEGLLKSRSVFQRTPKTGLNCRVQNF